MKEEALQEILTELSQAAGVCGNEADVVALAARLFEPHVTSVEQDRFGNLVAYKQGENRAEKPLSLAVAAHIDEIGAMVTKIEEGGFLRFTSVGGIDPRILLGQAVEVHGRTSLKGMIGAMAPHLLTEKDRTRELKYENLYIDLGFHGEAQAAENVAVGDFISLDQTPLLMKAGRCLSGKSMDNRAGVAAMVVCAIELAAAGHQCDIYFVCTLQEEVGVCGAITAAYGLAPDLAVALDVTHGETPGLSFPEVLELGKGPVITVGPSIHPRLAGRLQEVAHENRFSFQLKPSPGYTNTDADAFQVSREGVPCALLSIPLRCMHSSVETLSLDDLNNTGRLLGYFARSLDRPFVEGLSCI